MLKLTPLSILFKRSVIAAVVAMAPALSHAAIDPHPSEALRKALQQRAMATLQPGIDEVVRQANLVKAAYEKVQASTASGNEDAIAADEETLEAARSAFQVAQHNFHVLVIKARNDNIALLSSW
jgi:hypothetical protein